MARPKHDATEIARAALGEMPPAERDALLIRLLIETRDLSRLARVRNRVTAAIDELIADGALDETEDQE